MKASSNFFMQDTSTRHKRQQIQTLSARTLQCSSTGRTKGAILVATKLFVFVRQLNVAESIIIEPPRSSRQKMVTNLLNDIDMVLDPVDVFEVTLAGRRSALPSFGNKGGAAVDV